MIYRAQRTEGTSRAEHRCARGAVLGDWARDAGQLANTMVGIISDVHYAVYIKRHRDWGMMLPYQIHSKKKVCRFPRRWL